MKVIIPEERLEKLVFKFLDNQFDGLEITKGKHYDIVFILPDEDRGILGLINSSLLIIYGGLIDNIFSYFPIDNFEIGKIIAKYVEDRYNLKVKRTERVDFPYTWLLKPDTKQK